MASTDAYAAKCIKLGKKFSTQYPEEYAGYVEANEEYNRNEKALAELYAQRDDEAAIEAADEHIDTMED